MSFDQLGLAPELLRAVAQQGYTEPTPVQSEAIPLVLDGRDVLAAAQTGTGKTAAFVLPILQRMNQNSAYSQTSGRRPVRVLVLTPTRELCLQVEADVRTYAQQRPVRSTVIYGGMPFDPQVRKLLQAPEIVVATPGRLLDHVGQRTIDLSKVEVLVLDEADRMLDMGFIPDIRRIVDLLPKQRQTLLFSATFSAEVRRLAADFMIDPAQVQVAPRNTAAELVRQVVMPVAQARKRELLSQLVKSGRVYQALVFTRTKHGADRLARQLETDGITALAIHGNKSQPQRVRALDAFKQNKIAVLVATDVAARGLDIDALPHVVNYELPTVASDYVHRIGRTGRAGADGDAISLVSPDEQPMLGEIERLLGYSIETELNTGFAPEGWSRSKGSQSSAGDRSAGDYRQLGQDGRSRQGRRRPAPGGQDLVAPGAGRPAQAATRTSHGSGRHEQAAARRTYGSARPTEGSGRRPTQGTSRPAQGSGRPASTSIGRPVAMPGERLSRAI
jgi:ATP-dependent RNA helicase RhlE